MKQVKQFAVIGLGRFGSSVARTLCSLGHQVVGVDRDPDTIQSLADCLTRVLEADATEEEVIRTLGPRNFDCVVVSIGNDVQASIMVTLMLKEMGARQVLAKALSEMHGKALQRVGADRVVYPEQEMGKRVAHNLIISNTRDYIELATDLSIGEVVADETMDGKTLRQLNLRQRFGVNVMAIRHGKEIRVAPRAEDRVSLNDVLVVVGESHKLRLLEENQTVTVR